MKKNGLLLAALTAVFALTSGCVVAPSDPHYYSQPVYSAPPPPRHEYQGYPPVSDYVWISGYWVWGGSRHEWVPGRWEAPRYGHVWVPHRWERDGDHWRQSGGRWEQDVHARPAPRPNVVPLPPPRQERDNQPQRDWRGDPRNARDAQPRYEQRGEPRPAVTLPAPAVNQASPPRNERPAAINPAFRPRQEATPPTAPAPAPVAAPAPRSVQRDERAQPGDGSRSGGRRHEPGNER